jgi:hypothetical protein
MKITVGYSIEQKLSNFLEFLKTRAMEDVHENNRDLIADFIDKVLVVEMKHYANNSEEVNEDIEIPDDIILEPMKKAKAQFDAAFAGFLSGDGIPQTAAAPASPPPPDAAAPAAAVEPTESSTVGSISRERNGNGHAANKIRNLEDSERDTIRTEFMNLNGEITEDACLPILEMLANEVTIFQVTGFVSYLHREISCGRLTVGDMVSYEAWMKKQRKLWEQYEKNKIKRQTAAAMSNQVGTTTTTQTADPKFVPGFSKRTA